LIFTGEREKKATGMAHFSTLFMMIQHQHCANFVEADISNVLSPDKEGGNPRWYEKPRTCPDLPRIM